ncbi:hypothetical protein Q7P36_001146 [Cladosporium allicinum]
MNSVASKRLFQEYKHLTTDPPEGITAGPVNEDDLFLWEAMIQGPEGTPYEGGVFPAELKFPKDYPLMPPTMKFQCDIWHPNVYANGVVCISILHPPGDDPNHYEQASERWSPIQSVEKILISVMSMIAEPNDESPANVDAARMWRERRPEFESRVKADLGAVAFHARVMFGMIAIAIACWEAASSQPLCPGAQVLGLIWRMPGTAQAELQVVFVVSLAVRFVEDCGSAVAEVLDELQLVELEAVSVPLLVAPTFPPRPGNSLKHQELLEMPRELEVAVLGVRN